MKFGANYFANYYLNSLQAQLNLYCENIPILQPVLVYINRAALTLFFGAADIAVNIPKAETPKKLLKQQTENGQNWSYS